MRERYGVSRRWCVLPGLPAWRVLAQHRRHLPPMRRRTLHEHVQEHCMQLLRHWDLCRSGGHRVHRLLGREGPPGVGALECSLCGPGKYWEDNNCRSCPPGRAQGHEGKTECALCAPGTFTLDSDATACNDCSPGKFQPRNGSISCEPCDAASYQSEPGSSIAASRASRDVYRGARGLRTRTEVS